jgi:hypothetical protein
MEGRVRKARNKISKQKHVEIEKNRMEKTEEERRKFKKQS